MIQQPDLGEKPQGFDIVGDRPGQTQQTLVAFEDRHSDPGKAKQVRDHEPDRASSDHGHVGLGQRDRSISTFRCHIRDSFPLPRPAASAIDRYSQND